MATMTKGLGQFKTMVGYLPMIWFGFLILTVGLLVGHYFLGAGLIDRIGGTAWLLMISGLIAKLIGVGAGRIFELIATNSKPPMETWIADLGRSIIGQFFDLGATFGLVVGLIGLGGIAMGIYLVRTGKLKEEKEKTGLLKRVLALVLGVTLGLAVLGGMVAGLVVAFGGKVNFKAGSGSVKIGSQAKNGDVLIEPRVEVFSLAKEAYKSENGWEINFPTGWDPIKGEGAEGVIKKPTNLSDWAMMEVKVTKRQPEIDSGGYISRMKKVLEMGKTELKGAVFFEEPYEEVQEASDWKRYVFIFDYDDVISDKTVRVRLLKMEYYPPKSGDGYLILARIPVDSWEKYEKIIKESMGTFLLK